MSLKIEIDNGFTEAVLNDNCEFDEFYKIANVLQVAFDVKFDRKLHDFDTLYWDFEYEKHHLTLHYNVFLGVSIYPKHCKKATEEDNKMVIQIGTSLFKELGKA